MAAAFSSALQYSGDAPGNILVVFRAMLAFTAVLISPGLPMALMFKGGRSFLSVLTLLFVIAPFSSWLYFDLIKTLEIPPSPWSVALFQVSLCLIIMVLGQFRTTVYLNICFHELAMALTGWGAAILTLCLLNNPLFMQVQDLIDHEHFKSAFSDISFTGPSYTSSSMLSPCSQQPEIQITTNAGEIDHYVYCLDRPETNFTIVNTGYDTIATELRWGLKNKGAVPRHFKIYVDDLLVEYGEISVINLAEGKHPPDAQSRFITMPVTVRPGKVNITVELDIAGSFHGHVELIDFTSLNRLDFLRLLKKHFLICELTDATIIISAYKHHLNKPGTIFRRASGDTPQVVAPFFLLWILTSGQYYVMSGEFTLSMHSSLYLLILLIISMYMTKICAVLTGELSGIRFDARWIFLPFFLSMHAILLRLNAESSYISVFFTVTALSFTYALLLKDYVVVFATAILATFSFISGPLLIFTLLPIHTLLNSTRQNLNIMFKFSVLLFFVSLLAIAGMHFFGLKEVFIETFSEQFVTRLDRVFALLSGDFSVVREMINDMYHFWFALAIFTGCLPAIMLYPALNRDILAIASSAVLYTFVLSLPSLTRLHHLTAPAAMLVTCSVSVLNRISKYRAIALIATGTSATICLIYAANRYNDVFTLDFFSGLFGP